MKKIINIRVLDSLSSYHPWNGWHPDFGKDDQNLSIFYNEITSKKPSMWWKIPKICQCISDPEHWINNWSKSYFLLPPSLSPALTAFFPLHPKCCFSFSALSKYCIHFPRILSLALSLWASSEMSELYWVQFILRNIVKMKDYVTAYMYILCWHCLK